MESNHVDFESELNAVYRLLSNGLGKEMGLYYATLRVFEEDAELQIVLK